MKNELNDFEAYSAYLKNRSRLGLVYRRCWLYPRLNAHLHGRVLDIGCGIGDFVAYRTGTVGVDINPENVTWCRARGLEVQVMRPDALPFEDGAFEAAVLDNVLEHIAAPAALLGEVRRILRPGGTLVIGVPGVKGYASDPDHKVFYDVENLRATLATAGFEMKRAFHMPIGLSWLSARISQYCLYGVFQAGARAD